MNGFRFYADIPGTEYDPKESSFPRGRLPSDITVERLGILGDVGTHVNVIALLLGPEHCGHDGTQEALVSTFGYPNSDTSLSSVDRKYLRRCRRIPERVARNLHPRLFARLDAPQ